MSPKFVSSVAARLARAEDEVVDLKARVSLLKQEKTELWRELLRFRTQKPLLASNATCATTTKPTLQPSFMRPTYASQCRDSINGDQRGSDDSDTKLSLKKYYTIHGVEYCYIDGVLTERALDPDELNGNGPGYLKSTAVSRARQRDLVRSWSSMPVASNINWDGESTTINKNFTPPTIPQPQPQEIFSNPNTDLAPTTSTNWILTEPQLANVFQNHQLAMKGLRTAFPLARAALWLAARQHWPEMIEHGGWQGGPDFMRCAYGELEEATAFWTSAWPVTQQLKDFAMLRNFLAHPRPERDLGEYNCRLEVAERLVVKLKDKRILTKIKKVRDGWRAEAVRTLAEIEERLALAELPGAYEDGCGRRQWKHKHEMLFRRLVGDYPENDRVKYFPAVVVQAAETWARACAPELWYDWND